MVIQDVPIQRPNTLTRGSFGHGQRFKNRRHGVKGMPHLKVLSLEHINRLNMHGRIRDKHLVLHGVNLFFEFLGNVEVIVDKPVQMGICHRRRPDRRQLRRTLKPLPNIVGNRHVAVSDSEDEILAPDDMELISLNELIRTIDGGRVVMNRARDDENIITQDLELRALAGLDDVLHRQGMEMEQSRNGLHVLHGGRDQRHPDKRPRGGVLLGV